MSNGGKTVQAFADAGMIVIRCGDAIIYEHPQTFLIIGQRQNRSQTKHFTRHHPSRQSRRMGGALKYGKSG
jgi:hypothetical protein